jgi:hypothetical protein
MEKLVLQTAGWCAATLVAILAVAANQDWNHAHGRIVGAGMCLAVLPAALTTFPTFTTAGEKVNAAVSAAIVAADPNTPKPTITVRAGA